MNREVNESRCKFATFGESENFIKQNKYVCEFNTC